MYLPQATEPKQLLNSNYKMPGKQVVGVFCDFRREGNLKKNIFFRTLCNLFVLQMKANTFVPDVLSLDSRKKK